MPFETRGVIELKVGLIAFVCETANLENQELTLRKVIPGMQPSHTGMKVPLGQQLLRLEKDKFVGLSW